jgi:hypothetical protein
MGKTNKMALVTGEKLVVDPIEWDGDVAATIAIGVKSPLEVDHKTIHRRAAAAQPKFAGGTWGDVARLGNDQSFLHATVSRHVSSCASVGAIPSLKSSIT